MSPRGRGMLFSKALSPKSAARFQNLYFSCSLLLNTNQKRCFPQNRNSFPDKKKSYRLLISIAILPRISPLGQTNKPSTLFRKLLIWLLIMQQFDFTQFNHRCSKQKMFLTDCVSDFPNNIIKFNL